jgi:hypothetical protein
MTSARHQRKASWVLLALCGLVAFAPGSGIFGPGRLFAATEKTVSNPVTGLAISGFDPVAYFVDGEAKTGRAELELTQSGNIWRFRNEGNRIAFVAHPEVYTPRFGGYDPVAIARGTSVPGHPQIWTVIAERLYLFYSEQARDAFVADPGRIIAAAERKWPEVVRGAN